MSATFQVKVLSKDEKKSSIDLELTIINPDQKAFYNTKSFALMLLLDTFHKIPVPNSALLDEIPLSDILNFNLDSIKKKESKIIKQVKLKDIKNFPLSNSINSLPKEELQKFWLSKENLPIATLSITIKDFKFIDHLSISQTWESGAFNII